MVESVRTEKGPRQHTLLYMGSQIELPEGEHKLLAQCIGEIIVGGQPLLPYSEDIERIAQTYASQVIPRLTNPNDIPEQTEIEDLDHDLPYLEF